MLYHHCFLNCFTICYQDCPEGLEFNGTHQILLYADDVNLLDRNVQTIKKNKAALLDTSKEVGLHVRSLVTTARCPEVADGGEDLQIWRVAANILNKQSQTAEKGWSSSLGVGRGANNSSL
jgi:hypothetical protein